VRNAAPIVDSYFNTKVASEVTRAEVHLVVEELPLYESKDETRFACAHFSEENQLSRVLLTQVRHCASSNSFLNERIFQWRCDSPHCIGCSLENVARAFGDQAPAGGLYRHGEIRRSIRGVSRSSIQAVAAHYQAD